MQLRKIVLVTIACALVTLGVLLAVRASYGATTLLVHAGAGIRPPLDELGKMFEKRTGIKVEYTYKGSGCLLAEICFSRRGDLYIPGELFYVEQAKQRGLIEDSRVVDLVIEPLVKLETQREATEALRRLLTIQRAGRKIDMNDPDIFAARLEVERRGHAIVQAVLASPLGEPDLFGCLSQEEYEFFMPVQVTALAVLLAREAGFSKEEIAMVGRAAILQNIGYIWLEPALWQHKDSLSPEQRQEFEKHPLYGYEALSQARRVPPLVAEAVLQHHERWDGSGYPQGLKGWDISPMAQLIGMAETYYELVSVRPGRKPFSSTDAFEYVMAGGGELFDPELVQVFARRVPVYPRGVMVELNTQERGIIVDVNIGHVGRPVVRICYSSTGEEVYPPYDVDLSEAEHQFKLITRILDL